MRRHGWAFCLGLLVGGPAAAQPPAAGEPSPPAPDLPGVVVSQQRGAQPLVTPDQKSGTMDVAAEPGALPLPDPKAPAPGVPGDPMPVSEIPVPTAVGGPVAPPCPTPGGGHVEKDKFGAISEWLLFQSKSRQSGHFITPYRPPLIAWFPCERKCGVCMPWAIPAPVAPAPGCAVPGTAPCAPGPAPVAPQVSGPAPGPEPEVLSGFMKTGDGLSFTSGAAPMANPTTQLQRVSHWRPK